MPNKRDNPRDDRLSGDEEPQDKESYDLIISEETREKAEAEEVNVKEELEAEELFDTQRSDGHTYNPQQAQEQGLTYTPPSDPPTLPSEDDPQGAEVAAGFAPSMEDSNPDEERLPGRVDNEDLDLLDDINLMLHNNSETGNLTKLKVQVDNGVVNLLGTVPSHEDIALVHSVISELDGVVEIKNNLQVEVPHETSGSDDG